MPREFKEEPIGSFVRWQAITIAQLTFAINIVLGFTGASLAFGVPLLVDGRLPSYTWARYVFAFSLVVLLISMALGVWCVVNRLRHFRTTAQVARKRERRPRRRA